MNEPTMSKKEALALARNLRAEGKTVKVFRREGVYTRPGAGVVPFVTFEVREVAAPSELYSRALDVGIAEPTHDWLRAEARYVAEMIRQGGCDYNDSPDGGRGLLRECEQFVCALPASRFR